MSDAVRDEWDHFLLASPRGHYCALGSWLASFGAYGIGFELLLARNERDGQIIGGLGLLRVGVPGLRALCAPIGPIVDVGWEDATLAILDAVAARGRALGCAFVQLQPPQPAVGAEPLSVPALLPADSLAALQLHHGAPLRVGLAPAELLWIDFARADTADWDAGMLRSMSKTMRYRIRCAARAGLVAGCAQSEDELRDAYMLVEANGRAKGYPVRRWAQFGCTVVAQVSRGHAAMHVARTAAGALVGAYYVVLAGRRASYIMGGTVRTEPDPGVGQFLHWHVMRWARAAGLLGYDLTSRGTASVWEFKQGFRPQLVPLLAPCHLAISPIRTAVLRDGVEWLYRRRSTLARLSSGIARFAGGSVH